jgi:hypothetical protein
MFDIPQFGGSLHEGTVNGWRVTWEAKGAHRLWCYQSNGAASRVVCVVAFNPGSLSGVGENLPRDTTLRNIRDAMPSGTGTLVLNLFTLATTAPPKLFANWTNRDCRGFDVGQLASAPCHAVMFAYGDIGQCREYGPKYGELVKERIAIVRRALAGWPEIAIPTTGKLKNPAHPMNWRRQFQMDGVVEAVNRWASSPRRA